MATPASVACSNCGGRLFFVSAMGRIPAAVNIILTCTDCGCIQNAATLTVWPTEMDTAF